jgi:EAL domain-containing protein (putative c-di-GMP-specific phosphodiesterase class I)/ActR/RegA family two-component response regulator
MIDTIYIVDDDQQFADMLTMLLSSEGYQTETHYSVAKLINTCPGPNDVIILDLLMPDIDGVEMLRRLSELKCQSGLILVSGQDAGVLRAAEDLAKAQSLFHLTSFSKPFKLAEITHFLFEFNQKKRESMQPKHSGQWLPERDDLEYAIHNDQLVLFYQPQICLKTNALIGLEALIRWNHPEQGLIPPGLFIPLAESSKLIGPLTDWVIQEAIRQLNEWQNYGLNTKVSVNISADNISQFDLPKKLSQLIKESALQSDQLVLEITESALMTQLIPSLDVLTRMRMKGFQLSVDDFGTGYSSLSQLHKIPFTELKIDQSFVTPMLKDKDCLAIVETCIMLGHKLNMHVVAEGVEDEACLNELTRLGCDFAQGYYISRPEPAKKIFEWWEKR